MRVAIVYHTLSGTTRQTADLLAGRLSGSADADLIEVRDARQYSTLTAYASGAPRAMRGEVADVEPSEIDVAAYDAVALGSPVWAFSPTPAANGAAAALQGIEGKAAAVFVVSGGSPGTAAEKLAAALATRGALVRGAIAFTRRDPGNPERLEELARLLTHPPSGG
jgi:flavodoxin